MSPVDLSHQAELIVLGTVVSRSTRTAARAPGVLTLTTVSVQQRYKGTSADIITVVTHGGMSGNQIEVAEDQPKFTNGERTSSS